MNNATWFCVNRVRQMFWCNDGQPGVETAYLDGSGRRILAIDKVVQPQLLALDPPVKRLYIFDRRMNSIQFCTYDGLQCHHVYTDSQVLLQPLHFIRDTHSVRPTLSVGSDEAYFYCQKLIGALVWRWWTRVDTSTGLVHRDSIKLPSQPIPACPVPITAASLKCIPIPAVPPCSNKHITHTLPILHLYNSSGYQCSRKHWNTTDG